MIFIPAKKKGQLLFIYSCGHFLVDFACAYLMFSAPMREGDRLLSIILYNFCAFALQMPIGLIADRLNRNSAIASVGMLLIAISFLCIFAPVLCAVVLGCGNCLYHIGGGVDVLGFSDRKQWMLGVFVSPGAIGLFLGALLANSEFLSHLTVGIVVLTMSATVVAALHFTYSLNKLSGNNNISLQTKGRFPRLAFLCLFAVVVLRSYVGITLYTPWKNTTTLSALSVLGLALGKTLGGILADKFGAVRTSVLTLSLCSVLFVFSEHAAFGLLSIFLFNMTMPITLFAMAKLFSGARGFAFGCLTFALFLGCVPNFLSMPTPFYGEVAFHSAEAAVSLLLLVAGLVAGDERGCGDE